MKNLRNENEKQIEQRILRAKLIDQLSGLQDCLPDLCEGESDEIKNNNIEWAAQVMFNTLEIASLMQVRNSVYFDDYSKIVTYDDAVEFLQTYLKEKGE